MIKDAFNLLEYIKPDNHYVPLTTEDAKTIEKETKKEAKDFAKAALEFNKVDIATTRQKKKIITMTWLTSKGDRRQIIDDRIKVEDIFIDDDYFFGGGDKQETKNLCDYVLDDVDQNDILFEQDPNVVSKTEGQTSEPEQTFLKIFLLKNKKIRN